MTDAPQIDGPGRQHRQPRKPLLPKGPAAIAGWTLIVGGPIVLILKLAMSGNVDLGPVLIFLFGFGVKSGNRTAAKWGIFFTTAYLLMSFAAISDIATGGKLSGSFAGQPLISLTTIGASVLLLWASMASWMLLRALQWKFSLRTLIIIPLWATSLIATGIALNPWGRSLTLEVSSSAVNSAVFTAGEKSILTASQDGMVRAWATDSGYLTSSYDAGERPLWFAFLSEKGDVVLALDKELEGVAWNAATGEVLPDSEMRAIVPVAGDMRWDHGFTSRGSSTGWNIWARGYDNLETGDIPGLRSGLVNTIDVATDGERALVANNDGTAVIWRRTSRWDVFARHELWAMVFFLAALVWSIRRDQRQLHRPEPTEGEPTEGEPTQ